MCYIVPLAKCGQPLQGSHHYSMMQGGMSTLSLQAIFLSHGFKGCRSGVILNIHTVVGWRLTVERSSWFDKKNQCVTSMWVFNSFYYTWSIHSSISYSQLILGWGQGSRGICHQSSTGWHKTNSSLCSCSHLHMGTFLEWPMKWTWMCLDCGGKPERTHTGRACKPSHNAQYLY